MRGSGALSCRRLGRVESAVLCIATLAAPACRDRAAGVSGVSGVSEGAGDPEPRAGEVLSRRGEELIACGRLVHAGTRVVTWLDPGGYDAYRTRCRFTPGREGPRENPQRIARYGSLRGGLPPDLRERVTENGWALDDLRDVVRQVVIHFDACGTSRRCFEVLHDERGLSCHFLLDVDGTVYQTLDLKERAWHAGRANDASVGIEIAHVGARSSTEALGRWYEDDAGGPGVRFAPPPEMGPTGLPEGFVGRPARPELFRGTIQDRELVQYDFTGEQYRALERLLVALCRVFPRVRARVPREEDGAVVPHVLDEDRLAEHEGLLAHWHVSEAKVDPGPAFDWERILDALRRAGIDG